MKNNTQQLSLIKMFTEKPKWIIWLIWAIVGQYTDKMTQKCVKMSLFVCVVTHYGSNESNDSLRVFRFWQV